MLSHFPPVRDEESTYSIFSRMQFALQPPNVEFMGRMLFNKSFEAGRLNFQGSFDYLCNNLPSTFTAENFFYNNTIYPLFAPFLSKEKQEKALETFKGDYPSLINKSLNISILNKSRRYIRVCKQCIKEDFNNYGEPYYRRQHEIELNRMCSKHKTPLYEYNISPFKIPRRYDDYLTVLSNSKEIVIPEEFKKKLLDIAKDINTIFTSNLHNFNINSTKHKISNRLGDKGYSNVFGKKLQQKFCKDFKKYFTEEFLDYIGYNFDANSYGSWIRTITTTSKQPVRDPIKFILVINYLFGSFREFSKYNKEYAIFRKGPYPCLNIVCPSYNKLVINHIMQIHNSSGNPLASFRCEHCGFEYYRRGPDKNDNDIYSKTSVKDNGQLWYDKLKECIDSGFSISKTAKILGRSKFKNLETLNNKYNNRQLVEIPKIEIENKSNNLLLQQYKYKFLKFIEQNPNANRVNLFKYNPKAYSYLLKNDREWIYNTVKSTIKNQIKCKEENLKNYWLNKDKLLIKKLLEAIDKIKSEKVPYKRITISILQNYVCEYNLYQNRDKLPRCFQILDKVCETKSDCHKRKVNYIMKEMADNSVKITKSKVLFNTSSGNRANKELLSYIDEMIKKHNHGNALVFENSHSCK